MDMGDFFIGCIIGIAVGGLTCYSSEYKSYKELNSNWCSYACQQQQENYKIMNNDECFCEDKHGKYRKISLVQSKEK